MDNNYIPQNALECNYSSIPIYLLLVQNSSLWSGTKRFYPYFSGFLPRRPPMKQLERHWLNKSRKSLEADDITPRERSTNKTRSIFNGLYILLFPVALTGHHTMTSRKCHGVTNHRSLAFCLIAFPSPIPSSTLLALCEGIPRVPSQSKVPVMRKMVPCHDINRCR